VNDRKKKYKEVTKEKQSPVKPLFNSEDFPSLSWFVCCLYILHKIGRE